MYYISFSFVFQRFSAAITEQRDTCLSCFWRV